MSEQAVNKRPTRSAPGSSTTGQKRRGDTLGRYRLLRKVAQGGMAEVFIGRSYGAHGFEKTVAIKRILPRYGNDPHFVHMMVDEAKISVLLNHPNIAQIFELGEHHGDHFIVMEYVSGQALSSLMKRMAQRGERLGVFESVFICMEMLEGLHAAHTQEDSSGQHVGIIHRDVSPQNLLLSWDGHVKIIDFGIARAKNRIGDTEQGTIKGKLRYLAPEVIDPDRFDERDFDHRVDIWAAGVILHELVAWRKLFIGDDEFAVYDAICDGEIPDLTEQGAEPALMRIIQKALARHPKERYATAQEMADALRAYLYRRDPTFTPRRIADALGKVFTDEKATAREMEEPDPELAGDEGEVHLTSTQLPPLARTEVGRRSAHADSSKSGDGPDDKNRALKSALPHVEPDAQTVVAHLEDDHDDAPTRALGDDDDEATLVSTPTGLSRTKDNDLAHAGQASSDVIAGDERPQRKVWPLLVAALLGVVVMLGLISLVGNTGGTSSTTEPVVAAAPVVPTPPPERPAAFPLLVQTDPPGAELTISGDVDVTNTAPSVVMVTPGSKLHIVAQAKGYDVLEQDLVAAADVPELKLSLTASAVAVRLRSTRADDVLTVNGKPYKPGLKVTPGTTLKVEASGKGRKTSRKSVRVRIGQPVDLTLTSSAPGKKRQPRVTTPKPTGSGFLVVTTTGKWGRVVVNGRTLDDTTPVREKLPSGTYNVVVTHPPEGKVKRFKVTIQNGKTVRKTVSF